MSDTALNKIIQYGGTTARLAFVPNPVSGSKLLYLWFDTDLIELFAWTGTTWVTVSVSGGGSGITQLTGDVHAGPGSGSQVSTLNTTGVSPGSYTNTNLTVDSKGRITAASNGSSGGGVSAHAPTHEPGGSDPITNLSGTVLTSGIIPDARLSSNIVVTTDPRLTNARTPTAHATSHSSGGSDAVTVTNLAGFPGGTTNFLRADGTFAAPPVPTGADEVFIGPSDPGASYELWYDTDEIATAITPGGSDKQVQFNDVGSFAGIPEFTFDKTAKALSIGTNPAQSGIIRLPNGTFITSRNAANNGDINILAVDGLNRVWVGDTGIPVNLRGGQIVFANPQNASTDPNTLDDYREGTFTPTITGSGGASGQTYTTAFGEYTKIGRRVLFALTIQLSLKGTITGNVWIGGLPFPFDTTGVTNLGSFVIGYWSGLATAYGVLLAAPVGNAATTIQIFATPGGGTTATANLPGSGILDSFLIYLNGHYRTTN